MDKSTTEKNNMSPGDRFKGMSTRSIVIEIALEQEHQKGAIKSLEDEDKTLHTRISGIKLITTISSFIGGIGGGFIGFYTFIKFFQ